MDDWEIYDQREAEREAEREAKEAYHDDDYDYNDDYDYRYDDPRDDDYDYRYHNYEYREDDYRDDDYPNFQERADCAYQARFNSRIEALALDMKKSELILQADRAARARANQAWLDGAEQRRSSAEEAERVRKIAARAKRLAKEERKRSRQADTDALKAKLQEVAARAKENK